MRRWRRRNEAPRLTADRILGCLPRKTLLGGAGPATNPFAVARDFTRPIPRKDWPDMLAEIERLDPKWLNGDILGIKLQKDEPSCTSNATTGCFETVKNGTGRKRGICEMSAMSLFKRVGSARGGSSLDDNCREMAERGALPVTGTGTWKHTHPRTGFRKALPKGWEDTARYFRIQEWLDVDSFDSLITCLLRRIPVVIGYHIGRGGHSIYATKPVYKNRKWYVDLPGSWGPDYDGGAELPGHHLLSEKTLTRGIPDFGAFAPLVVTEAA